MLSPRFLQNKQLFDFIAFLLFGNRVHDDSDSAVTGHVAGCDEAVLRYVEG